MRRRSRPGFSRLHHGRILTPARRFEVGLVATVALVLLGLGSGSASPRHEQLDDGLYARITTNKGEILVRLEPDKTPLAVASFVGLAEGTIANDAFPEGEPYYDGSAFHRVVDGHVIQAGSPASGRSDARGPGYRYPNEIHADLSHDHAGAVGVANSGPHTNGAQFYITLGDRSYLDGTYIVFGEVVEGMGVVHSIVQGDVIESVRVERHGEEAQAYSVDTTRFRELVAAAEERVREDEVERRRLEAEWFRANLGDRLMWENGQRVFRRRRGEGEPVEPGDRIRVRYFGTAIVYRGHMIGYAGSPFEEVRFASSPEDGTPQTDDLDPPPFAYEVGSSSVTAGFDRAVEAMRRGDETLIWVPWQQAYGDGGFYGPDRPGTPRFVIPPRTTLIYAIEVLDSEFAGATADNFRDCLGAGNCRRRATIQEQVRARVEWSFGRSRVTGPPSVSGADSIALR